MNSKERLILFLNLVSGGLRRIVNGRTPYHICSKKGLISSAPRRGKVVWKMGYSSCVGLKKSSSIQDVKGQSIISLIINGSRIRLPVKSFLSPLKVPIIGPIVLGMLLRDLL